MEHITLTLIQFLSWSYSHPHKIVLQPKSGCDVSLLPAWALAPATCLPIAMWAKWFTGWLSFCTFPQLFPLSWRTGSNILPFLPAQAGTHITTFLMDWSLSIEPHGLFKHKIFSSPSKPSKLWNQTDFLLNPFWLRRGDAEEMLSD